jgi:hypothetical protein
MINDDLAATSENLLNTSLVNKNVNARENNRWNPKNCHLLVAPINQARKGPSQLQNRK